MRLPLLAFLAVLTAACGSRVDEVNEPNIQPSIEGLAPQAGAPIDLAEPLVPE